MVKIVVLQYESREDDLLNQFMEKNKNVSNYKMQTLIENGVLKYKYKLEEGISNIKGGIHVLKDLNYPKEIIENTL